MNSLNFNNGKVRIPLSSSHIRIVKILKILCKPLKRKGQPNNNFHISPSTIQFSTANTSQAWQLIHVVPTPGRASRAETLWIRGYPGYLVRFCPKYNNNSNNFKRKETESGYSSKFCKPVDITVLNPGSPFGFISLRQTLSYEWKHYFPQSTYSTHAPYIKEHVTAVL